MFLLVDWFSSLISNVFSYYFPSLFFCFHFEFQFVFLHEIVFFFFFVFRFRNACDCIPKYKYNVLLCWSWFLFFSFVGWKYVSGSHSRCTNSSLDSTLNVQIRNVGVVCVGWLTVYSLAYHISACISLNLKWISFNFFLQILLLHI